ncbi:MAG: hypothetical protein QM757_33405 [Paludibaculum sp.]
MIGQRGDMVAHALLLGVGFGDQVVVEGVKEVVAVKLIGAGIGLPIPLAVGAFGPARGDHLPALITRLLVLQVALGGGVEIGIRAAHGQDRSSHEALERRMIPTLGDRAEEAQCLEGGLGPAGGVGTAGGTIGEAFAGAVHGGPQAVVVAIGLGPFAEVAGLFQHDRMDIAIGCAAVALVDLGFKNTGLFGESHGLALNHGEPLRCGDPGVAVGVHRNGADIVVGQPAQALAVLPHLTVEADGALMRSEPDHTVLTGCHGGEVVVGQALAAGIEGPDCAVQDADPLRAGEPQPVFRIEGDAADIDGRPALGGRFREEALPGSDSLSEKEPIGAGFSDAAVTTLGSFRGAHGPDRGEYPAAVLLRGGASGGVGDDRAIRFHPHGKNVSGGQPFGLAVESSGLSRELTHGQRFRRRAERDHPQKH